MVTARLLGVTILLLATHGSSESVPAAGTQHAPGDSSGGCVTSRKNWRSTRFPKQDGTFGVEFVIIPGKARMNGITGLSFGRAEEYEDLAASVRFGPKGFIDARNGSKFESRIELSYKPGVRYHVRMVVRMVQRTYDVYVTPPGGAEQALALGYRFRSEQDDLDSLDNWALFAGDGRHDVCDFSGPGTARTAQAAPEVEEKREAAPSREAAPDKEAARPEPPPTPLSGSTAVLVGAGDIGNCNTSTDEATARLLDHIEGTVFTVGDNAYPDGSKENFEHCFEPTWGRHKERMRPVPGNHDYNTKDARGYFDYFGDRAGPTGRGFYSYNLGGWHILALNSNIDMSATSAQVAWLRRDLAANPAQCTLAYWHHPRFSSGRHGNDPEVQTLWEALYEAGADVILAGHDHDYERFAPQTPDGRADPQRGIREFVVGMGGTTLRKMDSRAANSEVRNTGTHGVLKLTLLPDSYRWEFVPVEGEQFKDAGTGQCH